MKAMMLHRICDLRQESRPLRLEHVPKPTPGPNDLLIKVSACGVCHTELDEIEGRTPPPRLPVILGHQVVGRVAAAGDDCHRYRTGDRVGIAWIHSACGQCAHCREGNENLCPAFSGTGRDVDGGYAEFTRVPESFAHAIPDGLSDVAAAPLLCAGAIGYRSLHLTGLEDGRRLGLTGFGASGHLVLKLCRHRFPAAEVFVFARSPAERAFALELGAVWAGDTDEVPPQPLHAIIDTTPAWKPVVRALAHLAPGGRLVINAIRKESADQQVLMELDYPRHLWMEKEIKSVANVQRRDVKAFLRLAAEIPIIPDVDTFPLESANEALMSLKQRNIRGAKVLVVNGEG